MFRAAKIAGYIKVTQRMGISVNQLLEGTRIDPDRVTNPNYLISLDQYYAVVANMMRLTNNPGIAFSLGELGNVKDMGIVGYAMMSARTLREASMVWMEYSNSLIGASTNIQYIREVSPGYEMTFSSGSRFNALHRFETEEILVLSTGHEVHPGG